jgi:hypothetical protein
MRSCIGHDKTLTYSHCRFEAKALHGVDNMAVADFDEFLYCPLGGGTAKGQSAFLEQFIFHNKYNLKVEQITMPQRVNANRTASPRDCMIAKVAEKRSILECFAPYEFYMESHSIKSVALGHICPLTGYHNSCPHDTLPRSYNCLCYSKGLRNNPWRPFDPYMTGRDCAFVHLSTNVKNYFKFPLKSEEDVELFNAPNELLTIINS